MDNYIAIVFDNDAKAYDLARRPALPLQPPERAPPSARLQAAQWA
jgi:hypothetical protein